MPVYQQRITEYLKEHPKLGEAIARVSQYNLLEHRGQLGAIGTGAGGLLGAAIGLIIMRKANAAGKVKGAAIGGLTGAGAGFMTGYYGPGVLQKGVGRIVTNIRDPVGYDALDLDFPVPKTTLREKVKAVITDKPVYDTSKGDFQLFNTPLYGNWFTTYSDMLRPPYSAREVPYRLMFGLQPREFKDLFSRDLRTGDLVINTHTDVGKRMREALESRAAALESVRKNKSENYTTVAGFYPTFPHPLFGTTSLGKNVTKDRWDFDLDPGEKVDSYPNLLRVLANMLTTPQTMALYYKGLTGVEPKQ